MLGMHAVVALLLAGSPAPGRAGVLQDTCRPRADMSWGWNQPTFTPYTRAPELKNREEARGALEALYPAELKARGVSGATYLWAHVDRCGSVIDARVRQSSGYAQLDSAALRVARLMRFWPALQGQTPIDVWIQLPILFGPPPHTPLQLVPRDTLPEIPPDMPPPNGRSYVLSLHEYDSDALPRLDAPEGYVGPSLLNTGQMRAWLSAGYSALGGRGGDSVRIALHIDEQGRVSDARIAMSSGWPSLDSLALAVARWAVFTPAVDPYRRYTSLWTTLPLRFPPPAQP